MTTTMPTVRVTGDATIAAAVRRALAQMPLQLLDESGPRADIALVAITDQHEITDAVLAVREADLGRQIVVVSAITSPEGLVDAVAAGADGWILPDVPVGALSRTLQGIHDGESGFSRQDTVLLVAALRRASVAPAPHPGDPLTRREREIHASLAAGSTIRGLAQELSLSEVTVRWHASRAAKKFRPGRRSLESASPGRGAPTESSSRGVSGSSRIPAARAARRADDGAPALTPAELRVAVLVSEGLSNPEVAELLFISRHTVESHLKQVFAKFGVRSRVELTRRMLTDVSPHRAS